MKTRFNLTKAVHDAIQTEPLISSGDLFVKVSNQKPAGNPAIKMSTFNSTYYTQRRKVHSRTTQRTTGFNQKSLNVEALQSAAKLIESVGKQHAITAVTLLAKLMK